MAPLSRRDFLQTAALGLAGATGCVAGDLAGTVSGNGMPAEFTNDAYVGATASTGTWPVEGHDAGRTSHTAAPVPLGDVDAAWLRRPGDDPHGATAPVIGPDFVHVAYTESRDGAASTVGLVSYDARDGTLAIDRDLGAGRAVGLALAGDHLLAVRRDADEEGTRLDALARDGGSVSWTETLPDVTGPPAIHDDTVYLATRGDDAVHAFDLDGTRVWRSAIDGSCYTATCADDDGVYVGLEDGRVAAVAPDGTSRWVEPVVEPDDCCPDIQGTPTVADGTLFVPGIREELVAVDTDDGAIDWRATVVDDDYGNPLPSPAVSADTAYVNTHHGGLVALALEDGRVRWRSETTGSFLPPAVGAGGLVVPRGDAVVGYDGDRPAWTVHLAVPDAGMAAYIMRPRVALAHGRCYVALHDGRVYAIGTQG